MTLYDGVPERMKLLRDVESIPWRLKTLYDDIHVPLAALKVDYLSVGPRTSGFV